MDNMTNVARKAKKELFISWNLGWPLSPARLRAPGLST
jgi:hypothetical protein